MKIGIIGGGSIGLLFASYLIENFETTLYTNTLEQANEIRANGIHLVREGMVHNKRIEALPFGEWTGEEEFIIVAVKQYHLDFIYSVMKKHQNKGTTYIFLQNGMGHLRLLEKLITNTIYVCSVEHGANKQNSYTVQHNGIGISKIALYSGNKELPEKLFSVANFPFIIVDDYFEMLQNKLIVNAIINPLTAILKVTNGEIIINQNYYQVLKDLLEEIVDVLDLEDGESYLQKIVDICHNTHLNRSSMLKDIECGRPTEVDSILGYILEEAERKKKIAPICKTLFYFIKGSES